METKVTKIGVLLSGGGTNLQAIIDAEKRGELGNGKITLAISSKPGVYGLERASNHGIPTMVVARKDVTPSFPIETAILFSADSSPSIASEPEAP